MRTSADFIATARAVFPVPAYRLKGNHLVLVFATDMDSTLDSAVMGGIPASLLAQGYRIGSLDLPAHGADATAGVQPLDEWKNRIAAGNTALFTNFAKSVSRLIDQERATDVSIAGQSRGGYCGLVCAALDARIKRLFLTAPVVDLQKLTEFSGYTVDQSVFGLSRYNTALSSKIIKIRINATDTRVDTPSVQSFAAGVGADISLVTGSGHVPPDDGACAAWLLSKISP